MVGIVGGPLVMASGIAVLFGVIKAGSTAQGAATILEIVWEIGILGLYLIVRGFVPSAATALADKADASRRTAPADRSSADAAATVGAA